MRFAEGTSVSMGKSRGEIDDLLRAWGCNGVSWLDDYEAGVVQLQFRWKREDLVYLARFTLRLPTEDELRARALDGRTKRFSQAKLDALRKANGQQEHRILLLWLKAAFNAVDAGIVDAAVLFLPFLVGQDGQTVADVAVPKLAKLLRGSATALLSGPTA
jgi:hypothetical protein